MKDKLIDAAKKAAEKAYAPYSNFKVGAAVLLEGGMIVTGNNQENSSFSAGICAERVALNYAKSEHPDLEIQELVLTSPSTDQIISPCGICRQVMQEIVLRQKKDFDVTMVSGNKIKTMSVKELLPLGFVLPEK